MAKKALGKGLGALIKPAPSPPTQLPDTDTESVQYLSIHKVYPSPHNPRKEFTEDEIEELAASIREHGVIQPLIVREVSGKYELIAGERRWRASQNLTLKTVPCIVRVATDKDVLEMALIENLQRQDLNPIEEAAGYIKLAEEFDLKQEDIAKRVGKSRASVANMIRLLDLGKDIQVFLIQGLLTVGHAKVLLGVKDLVQQRTLADQVIRHKLTVRQTEQAVKRLNEPEQEKENKDSVVASPEISRIQNSLRERFSTQVSITDNGKKGKIQLEFYGQDDLQRLLDILGIDAD